MGSLPRGITSRRRRRWGGRKGKEGSQGRKRANEIDKDRRGGDGGGKLTWHGGEMDEGRGVGKG